MNNDRKIKGSLLTSTGRGMQMALLMLCSACFWGATLSLSAATGEVIPSDVKSTPTTPDGAKYLLKPGTLDACKSAVAAMKGKPCDIIFIGDSITQNWKDKGKTVWDKFYASRNALNFGVGGDNTQNVLWRLDNLDVKDLKPKVAVILIGTNNRSGAQGVADGVKAVVTKTRTIYPGAKVILVSIMPRGLTGKSERMAEIDAIIKTYADNKNVYYVDLFSLMPPVVTTTADGKQDHNFKGLSSDHLHPDVTGYQIWADAMEPLLAKLLAAGSE